MQNPSKVYRRNGLTSRCHIYSPTGTPKVRNRARESSHPSQDTEISHAFHCIRHTGRQAHLVLWHPRGQHGRISPASPNLEARLHLQPLLLPLPLTLRAAVFFTGGGGLQDPPQTARLTMAKDTCIPEGKIPLLPKKQKRRQSQER